MLHHVLILSITSTTRTTTANLAIMTDRSKDVLETAVLHFYLQQGKLRCRLNDK